MLNKVVMMILITALFTKVSAECEEGNIQLVDGSVPNEGRVEICIDSNWATVCNDHWGYYDAIVVCRELGYGPYRAQYFRGAYFGPGNGPIALDNVDCDTTEARLLDCRHVDLPHWWHRCESGGGAAVRCRNSELNVRNVGVALVNASCHTTYAAAVVSWELQDNSEYQPNSFSVECSNEQHRIKLSMDNNHNFTTQVGGLLFSVTYYICCVSAVYGSYVADGLCALLPLQSSNISLESAISTPNEIPQEFASDATISRLTQTDGSDNRISIVGGVLGFVIAILLILLAICGSALLCLLRSRSLIPKRSSMLVDTKSVEMPVNRNISYITAASHSTSGYQITQATRAAGDQGGTGAAAEYSRIGPSYATTVSSRRQQPVAGRNQVSARLSERYEFSEPHMAMASAGGGSGGGQGETAMDYEIPLQSGEQEEYSHLQH